MTIALNNPATTGIKSLTFGEYVELDALNWHTLEPFRKSSKHGRHQMCIPDDASESQNFGAGFHTSILEPGKFDQDFAVMPRFEGHPNSNGYKAEKAAWLEQHKLQSILTAGERDDLLAMQSAVKAHPLASALLYGKGRNEMSIVWRGHLGTLCKGRVDRLARVKVGLLNENAANANDDCLCLIDLKTTRFAEPDFFMRDAAKYGYHGQLAMYHDGLQALAPAPMVVLVIAIENAAPFDVVVYQINEQELEHGRRLYRRLIETVAGCRSSGKWPGVSDKVVPLYLPDWCKEASTEE